MPASKAQQAATADRRRKAIALQLAGASLDAIVDQLDYASTGAAATDIKRAMEANQAQLRQIVDERRDLETARLDRLQAAHWKAAVGGDTKAGELVLRIIDRRIKLHGIDAPVRADIRVTDATMAEIADLVDEMALLDAQEQQQALARERG